MTMTETTTADQKPDGRKTNALKWPPEHDDVLRAGREAGLSCLQIAVRINEQFGTAMTRKAVIGRAMRLKIPTPNAAGIATPGRKVSATRTTRQGEHKVIAIRAPVEIAPVAEAAIEPRHVALIQLRSDDCRYPYGDGPFTFCGHLKLKGFPYCAPHVRLARGQGTVGERTAGHVLKAGAGL